MSQKINKIIKKIFIILCVLVIGGGALNWYLKNRLENYLKEALNQKVSDATDGFYNITFKELSIGLFNGELLIEGIRLIPDSAQFVKLKEHKLLPQTYFKINVGSIYFKGVNLTWRINYKKLQFKLFEVKEAKVAIYNTKLEASTGGDTIVKNLGVYDIISPYIDVLSVKQINLENSGVIYFTDDGVNPVSFGLKNIKFSAYGFVLDKDSEISGNLLYSDYFNFESSGEQTLLANTQFRLNTKQIKFDTRDSIIQIQDIEIIPQKQLWERIKKVPNSYLEGKVKSVNLAGIAFRRDSAINRLNVESFDINKPYIEYIANSTSIKKTRKRSSSSDTLNIDSLNLSWSLYSVISPILAKVEIKEIGVNEAKFKYLNIQDKDTTRYTLDNFKLTALGFLVDSISDTPQNYRFLYSENFGLQAKKIEGVNTKGNYHFNVGSMVLSTIDKRVRLDSILLKPITKNTPNDYIVGSIESVDIDSLYYNLGLDAGVVQITNPIIEYVRSPQMIRSNNSYTQDSLSKISQRQGTSVWTQISPFFNHLSVLKIDLKNGNIIYRDKAEGHYSKINNLNLLADNAFVDQQTINSSHYLSAINNLNINYSSIESIISQGLYKISSGKGNYDLKKGTLQIENLNLKPHQKALNSLDKYYKVSIPLIKTRRLQPFIDQKKKLLQLGFINILSPNIEVVTNRLVKQKKQAEETNYYKPFFDIFSMNNLTLSNVRLRDIDKPNRDTLNIQLSSFVINDIDWSRGSFIKLRDVQINNPNISVTKNGKQEQIENTQNKVIKQDELPEILSKGVLLDQFRITNLSTSFKSIDTKLKTNIPLFSFNNLKWNTDNLSVGELNLIEAKADILKNGTNVEQVDTLTPSKSQPSIYNELKKVSKQISIKQISIKESDLNYHYVLDTGIYQKHQQFNKTSLFATDFFINAVDEVYKADDIKLEINKFSYPLDNGFYSLSINKIFLDSKKELLDLDSIALIPAYSKEIFGYKHPQHKDWFDVTSDQIKLRGLDLQQYFKTKQLNVDSVFVDKVFLQNYKNQQIPIIHRPMPMLYEGLQKLPLKLKTNVIDVKNFHVVYEELPQKGSIASKIFFTNMNGRIKGLTNITSYQDQMYLLKADGYLMGSGYFKADWYLPVSPNYDCFELNAKLESFNLTELNQLITPMAPVRIDSGLVKSVTFNTEANSLGASINMLMLYNGLKLTIQKSSVNENPNKLFTTIVNKVLKSDNPRKPNKKEKKVHAKIVRDPNHSTFNYIWQILQPPLVETVGVPQRSQKFIKRVTGFISKVKNIFKKHPKNNTSQSEAENKKND